jgi:hypothetical protein
MNSAVSNGKVWVMGGYANQGVIYSANGVDWLPSVNFNSNTGYTITYNGSVFIASSYQTNPFNASTNQRILTSSDGLNWTVSSSGGTLFASSMNVTLSPGQYTSQLSVLNNNLLQLASIPYTPNDATSWDTPAPTTLAAAIDRLAAALSNSIGFAIP